MPDIEYTPLQALLEGEKRATRSGAVSGLLDLSPEVLEVVCRAGLDQRLGRERMLSNSRVAIERYPALYAGTGEKG